MEYLVLSAKPYSFESKEGTLIEGCKVSYISRKKKENGHDPLIVNVRKKEVVEQLIGKVPGIFELDFDHMVGKNNKPELVLDDAQLISPVDFNELF